MLIDDVVKAWTTYSSTYMDGIKNTLLLAFVGTLFGCLIGFLCGILQTIPYKNNDSGIKKFLIKLLRGIIRVYVEFFRGTPMVLQAVFFYYGLPYLTQGAKLWSSVWACAMLVVSINTGAYMAETVRGGILSIDNYADAIDKLDDKEISYLNSFVTTMVSDWMNEYHVFFKRITAERFFFVAQMIDLKKMMDKKFDLLDRLRAEAERQNLPITLSMGIAYGQDSLDEIGGEAQNNLDIALVRGGDQVVVKELREGAKPVYYGGKSAKSVKRTRVRSRAMSTALRKIFTETGDVFIMGHKFPDMDAIGSAFGVSCLARFNQKKAYIVLDENEIIPDVERCLEEIHKHPELEAQLISPKKAMELNKEEDLLVMVDYHKPSLSISQSLYEQFDKIVIIDHHRRGEEFPSKPLLTYIESSASSASELVTELIQYQSNRTNRLDRFEATLLLAGMTVDTNSFNVRTTARTFDVASYLRSCSADASLVQYLLSSDLATYLEISHLIAQSEYVTSDIVVAAGTDEKEYNSVIAAKTADTLLSMININGAFVITKRTDGLVGISARSSGTINVQVIMESLGGGGHFTNAATQLEGVTVEETKQRLLAAIKENRNQLYDKE